MLSEKDKAFILFWEKNRTAQNTLASKIARGLPMAVLFVLPVILLVLSVWLFIPEWYIKISKTSPGMFATALFALFLVVLFYSFFRMQHKWEMNEQLYQELKAKDTHQPTIKQ
jgi:cbb3-type cytochrome oxidase subunit 3